MQYKDPFFSLLIWLDDIEEKIQPTIWCHSLQYNVLKLFRKRLQKCSKTKGKVNILNSRVSNNYMQYNNKQILSLVTCQK